MTSYEHTRQLIENVRSAAHAGIRDVQWVTEAQVVGVARDPSGRVEVFLAGPELRPSSSLVSDAIEFRVVHRAGQPSFGANRLLMPPIGHFDQVAAFICTELLRGGADSSLRRAFAKTEPIIELAIERLRRSNQAIVGLAGELRLIDALCRRAEDTRVAEVITGWDGWRRSSRDLIVGGTGIEVKTTTGLLSSHLVEGIHQVERKDGSSSGNPEERLLLVSIGLQAATDGGNTFTIPQLMDRILARMSASGIASREMDKFLTRVAEYGAGHGGGYDHLSQVLDPAYATAFLVSFFRAYDMSDPDIQVLRRHDVTARHHVDLGSVRFRVDLPVVVGLTNPVNGASQVAASIIG